MENDKNVAKRQKLTEEEDENHSSGHDIEAAQRGNVVNLSENQKLPSNRVLLNPNPPAPSNPSPIFKLNVDCCEEILEYLRLEDLNSFGQTCKPLNKVAGEYFKDNYCASDIKLTNNNSIAVYLNPVQREISMPNFNQFTTKLNIYFSETQYLDIKCDEFKSIKQLCILGSINERKINYIRNILPKIEVLEIKWGCFTYDLHEMILKFCENLQCLYLNYVDAALIGIKWF